MVVWWAAVWWLAVVCHGASAAADDPWAGVRKIVDGGVSSRVYPGAAAIVGTKNGIVFEHYAGRQTYGEVPPHSTTNQEVGEDTIFDLASLSKVVATTSVVAQLYENGLIDLGARVASAELRALRSERRASSRARRLKLISYTLNLNPALRQTLSLIASVPMSEKEPVVGSGSRGC